MATSHAASSPDAATDAVITATHSAAAPVACKRLFNPSAGLQKISAQLEVMKATPQTVSNH